MLWAVFERIRGEGVWTDFLAVGGIYYRRELAGELLSLAREHRNELGGDIYFGIIRITGALRRFSFDGSDPDASVFSADEIGSEVCALLELLVPKVVRNEEEQARKLKELADERNLMRVGMGAFKRVDSAAARPATHERAS